MPSMKSFIRHTRKELQHISSSIKRMEHKICKFKGFLRKELRQEMMELRRMKEMIMKNLLKLASSPQLEPAAIKSIRDNTALLQERCQRLKAEHF